MDDLSNNLGDDFTWDCWSCGESMPDGISIDDSGEQHICHDCWDKIPVQGRLVLGLLFRRANNGGIGLKELIRNAIERYPFGGSPGNN